MLPGGGFTLPSGLPIRVLPTITSDSDVDALDRRRTATGFDLGVAVSRLAFRRLGFLLRGLPAPPTLPADADCLCARGIWPDLAGIERESPVGVSLKRSDQPDLAGELGGSTIVPSLLAPVLSDARVGGRVLLPGPTYGLLFPSPHG